ncbi:hypothetical protein CH63R_09657 [Colletotrichum higginsianum IMI 349063]|uniref:Uncharacterized protein n=1 Tax=Colletotrichum higginsianum (strain IMI 349063) TaxID=759273 RepID=A0A1B7Y7X0_COLHI|nr:hypothetical protein CH63R_09657 [Colletotrichum higginsianum IMI 349063]OBR08136.1 hypothetical protein CH63R_09657 [Colletotrichum higginsianum IMI 349063]
MAFSQWFFEDEKLQITVETKACPVQDNTSDCGRLAQLSDAVLPDLVGDPLEQSVALQKKIWDCSAKLLALLSHLDPSQTC